MNREFAEFFAEKKRWKRDAADVPTFTDSDLQDVIDRIIEGMRPASSPQEWEQWKKGWSKAMGQVDTKNTQDLTTLLGDAVDAFPASTAPLYSEMVEAASARIGARLTKEAQKIGKALTAGRVSSTKVSADKVVADLKSAGMSTQNIRDYITTLDAEAKSKIEESFKTVGKAQEMGLADVEKHASDLARDQILTTNDKVTQMKLANLAVNTYEWVSQRDSRVRDNHRELDAASQRGKVFDFADPPLGGGTGPNDRGNPGSGYGCRCAAFPIIE